VKRTSLWNFPFKRDGAVVHPVVPFEDKPDSECKEEREWVEYVNSIAVFLEPPVQGLQGVENHGHLTCGNGGSTKLELSDLAMDVGHSHGCTMYKTDMHGKYCTRLRLWV
jgi:hypothetical protein